MTTRHQPPDSRPAQDSKLGTFAGVFTPSVLTILGIILFLRLGFVVGTGGLVQTLAILLLANSISILTSLSLAAVATNFTVRGGGDYYLISRTLGFEFGGALGMVLFLAQAISIGFYCVGFGEVAAGLLGAGSGATRLIALAAVGGLFLLAWQGADWATRFQYLVMTVLGLALLSFFIGGLLRWDAAVLKDNWPPLADSPGFWILFAIFFPAVTGFTQGVSMSGDLQDPGRSLPRGTFLAVGLSLVIYLGAALVFAGAMPREVLAHDYQAMQQVALVGFLVTAGVFAATLSSAMASFLGAPRILQSLAADKIFPMLTPFAKSSGAGNNPRRAVLLAAGIALLTVSLGNLNLIARIVAMFFLISYGLLNYATYFEARAGSPSFRPRFTWFHARASQAGAILCLLVMLAIDWKAGVLAVAVMISLYHYLEKNVQRSRWADSRRSYHLQQVREHLVQVAEELEHPRDWRPQLLVFSDSRERRGPLLQFGSWLAGTSGLVTLVRIIEKPGFRAQRTRKAVAKELYQDIVENEVQAFPLAVTAPDFATGNYLLLQSFGIGPLRANTILLNYQDQAAHHFFPAEGRQFGMNLETALRLDYNLVLFDADAREWSEIERRPAAERRIDIWYRPDKNGALMLLFGYLLTRTGFWSEASLRVLTEAGEEDCATAESTLREELDQARISADTEIVRSCDHETVSQHSGDASLVLLPLTLRRGEMISCVGEPAERLLAALSVVALIVAAEQIDLDAEPDMGAAGQLAEAEDRLAEAEKEFQETDQQLHKVRKDIENTLQDLLQARQEGNEEAVTEQHKQLTGLHRQLDEVSRRAARSESRVEHARQRLQRLRDEYQVEAPEEKTDTSATD